MVNKSYAEKLNKTNPRIKCEIYQHPFLDKEKNEEEYIIRLMNDSGHLFRIQDRVEFVNQMLEEELEFLEQNKLIYPEITKILQRIKPGFSDTFFLKSYHYLKMFFSIFARVRFLYIRSNNDNTRWYRSR